MIFIGISGRPAIHFDCAGTAGGPPLTISMCSISTEGAPSLRFCLQGWASMMPVLYDLSRSDGINRQAQAFPCPALRKRTRRTGHPHLWWLLQFESRANRPPTFRLPERTGVALRSDLAHGNHQNSNFLFRLR